MSEPQKMRFELQVFLRGDQAGLELLASLEGLATFIGKDPAARKVISTTAYIEDEP